MSAVDLTDGRGHRIDIGRMCTGKCRYTTRRKAKQAARRYGHKVYRCPLCHLWHLTSRSPRNREDDQ